MAELRLLNAPYLTAFTTYQATEGNCLTLLALSEISNSDRRHLASGLQKFIHQKVRAEK